jgi:hypothetical protein
MKMLSRLAAFVRTNTAEVGVVVVAGAAILVAVIGAWTGAFTVLEKFGSLGAAVAIVLAGGILLTSLSRKSHTPKRRKSMWTTGIVLISVAVITGVPVTIQALQPVAPDIGAKSSEGSSKVGSAPNGGSAEPPSSTRTPPSGVPIAPAQGCPLPDPTDPSLPSISVTVVYWCKGEVLKGDGSVDDQNYQIKLRPRLVNNTASTMDISLSKPSPLRLLVTAKQVDKRWSPPPLTRKGGDKPILVECNGGTFWGIPPNLQHDATLMTEDQYSGFATIWDGSKLGPGKSYFKPLRHRADRSAIQEGDLVFQVPNNKGAQTGIYGLAVLDLSKPTPSVLGVAMFENKEQWISVLHPTQF